ncbi:unnamed protein product [Polarella glacialis]|uniref:Uncharacterized protein n=1 Tax=Polarella glacialis TaxID=89957 RepID=A0A813HGX1_POLGL|nr:unnamed protein product [Polarella glacialis]
MVAHLSPGAAPSEDPFAFLETLQGSQVSTAEPGPRSTPFPVSPDELFSSALLAAADPWGHPGDYLEPGQSRQWPLVADSWSGGEESRAWTARTGQSESRSHGFEFWKAQSQDAQSARAWTSPSASRAATLTVDLHQVYARHQRKQQTRRSPGRSTGWPNACSTVQESRRF